MAQPIVREQYTNAWKYDQNYHRTMDFFGIDEYDRQNFKLAKKAAYLYDWASQKIGDQDIENVLEAIRQYRKALGVQVQGATLVDQLYINARLDSDRERTQKIKEKIAPDKSIKDEDKPKTVEDVITSAVKEAITGAIKEKVSENISLPKEQNERQTLG